jgi:hypothetical protein
VRALRDAFRTLTSQSTATKEQLVECEQQIASAHETIRGVQEKLGHRF